MEDSYMVHRRRKAAARRREKTTEVRYRSDEGNPSADGRQLKSEDTISMDEEEEERRARMERMVEDTERLEKIMYSEEDRSRSRSRQRQPEKSMPMVMSSAVSRIGRAEDILQEDESKNQELPVSRNAELSVQGQEQEMILDCHPSIKVTRRSRKSGNNMELRRRMSSPESSNNQVARHPSSSPSRNMSPNEDEQSHRSSSKRRVNNRHLYQNPSNKDQSPVSMEDYNRRRSASKSAKKQIIPLNNNCLIADVAKAKWAYTRDEIFDYDDYNDYEREEDDDEYIKRRKRESMMRRRKASIVHSDDEREEIEKSANKSASWLSWIPFFRSNKQKVDERAKKSESNKLKKKMEKRAMEVLSSEEKLEKATLETTKQPSDKVTFRELFRLICDMGAEFREYCRQNPREVRTIIELRNLCIVETIIVVIVCGLGGFIFRFTEGAFESFYKCGVKRVKRDFLDSLWYHSHNMKEDDWKSMARRKLMDFEEQLHTAHEAGIQTYSGQRSWSFLNAMVYCLTIVSTIGYGHLSPSTTTGRALTIIYAIFGIPMFLIVLADFGKLFTRGIKFLWAFVRRLYYTGSCRKVRRTVPMQEMMKGVQLVYDLATFRRSSQMSPEELAEMQCQQQTVLNLDGSTPQQADSPSTPAMSTFEIDDEFNLPISVAITILILYIFVGAMVFNVFEEWSFFESFYFVFISMSTIGFGDFVPQDPLYMMLSIVYLIFGLALTSMCINVVQVMLADQFKHASQKIGASIGFQVSEEDGSLKPAAPDPVEVAEDHSAIGVPSTAAETDSKDKAAPKAKQEDDEL
ncbi:PREDICTED: uncharacterized protein LOC105364559 [Ceratosolen solmsi marchali]|uniref:Uncharacterized protein LOC105364559 n=1 Tax=Ceratosolen solmsi marchali TaxID=326594 RepID=A0AAJ6YMI2_9HYME|nr:PREDICTED: uncharacterized protein LOC105364559 [Ceratosolen solmsi marchali]